MELLSEGIYEEAHAKVSSVRLGTEKAQKVETAVKFEGDLGRHCEFGIPWFCFVEKPLLIALVIQY